MPKYIGAPRLVIRKTFVEGEFTGKFEGDPEGASATDSLQTIYDLLYLSGEIDANASGIRHWQKGESEEFRDAQPFLTPILNPVKCNVHYPSGEPRHFFISLQEPKLLGPRLSNQVYEGSAVYTTLEGRVSGYLTHFELAGAIVELPLTRPKENRVSSKIAPDTSIDDSRITEYGSGYHVDNSGCLNVSEEGCATGCFAIVGVFVLMAILATIVSLFSSIFSPVLPVRPSTIEPSITVPSSKSKAAPEFPESTANTGDKADGRTGRFTTNQHLRTGPSLSDDSVGIHFENATFKVMEEESHTGSGGLSTWYRVQITSYGCDSENPDRCGKNDTSDLDVGWLNAKYVVLD